ncbi:MAG: M6 family metalloprotease domain-containing protein [Verrucomicrobia bacterium]|nr:M6 family metalloprotease domain-containing protein [Verrucomicrobiota bacterium]
MNKPRLLLPALCSAAALALAPARLGAAAAEPAAKPPDLSDYKTVATAITTEIKKANTNAAPQNTGYLGVNAHADRSGKVIILDVGPDTPAAKAGIQPGDQVVKLGATMIKSVDDMRDYLQAKPPGEPLLVNVKRKNKSIELVATLGATSRPMKMGAQRPIIGITMGTGGDEEGIPISRVSSNSPAEKAGLRSGDVILKVNGISLSGASSLTDNLADKNPGDTVTLVYRRDNMEQSVKVELAADTEGNDPRSIFDPTRTTWKKDLYRMAVILVEYPDVKHNEKITTKAWADSFFSTGTYNKTNATGQPTYGSLNDYYLELSCGKLRVEGKVFDWIEVSKKRADYGQTATQTAKTQFLVEAMDALVKREGADALKEFDGAMFIYAGSRFSTANRGSLYWPHRASVSFKGKSWPYFICPEGEGSPGGGIGGGLGGARFGGGSGSSTNREIARTMQNISVFCHEFGHMLGLPDLYARPENPGSEGLGNWCAMSNQTGAGRPQHMGAWCKERLGWLKPAVIDPTVKQKLILSPIQGTTNECYKVLVRPDASEYLLIENRRKIGFDKALPGEGLLIWRIVGSRVILEESHGVEGPSGPRVFPTSVPFPSKANDAYTPFTTPSSRSQLGGGLPVHITNIRQLPDGRVTFHIGYEYQ